MARLRVVHIRLLIPFVVLAWRASLSLGDNSFLWHVRAGTLQIDGGEVLRVDPFSFTALGETWRTQSWLAELGYGWLERAFGGIGWVPLMKFAAMSLTIALLGLVIHRVCDGRHWVTLGAMLFLVWQAAPFGIARPALIGFLFLAVTVATTRLPRVPLWLLPPLFWLWASIHGMFVVGLGYVLLDAIGRRSRRQVVAVAISALATALTAHGLGAWWIVAQFLRNRSAVELMSEWQPPDFSNPFLFPFVLIILGLIAAGARRRLAPSDLWVVIPFVGFGLLAERNVYPAVVVLAPVAVGLFASTERSQPRASNESVAINWVFAVGLIGVAVLGLARPMDLKEQRFPARAAIAALEPGPVFHDSAVGGYLIFADWPERLVFIDDRAELFGVERLQQFQDARDGIGIEETFAEFGIRQALMAPDWSMVGYLDLLGWDIRYEDEYFVVMSAG